MSENSKKNSENSKENTQQSNDTQLKDVLHHQQQELCKTRPAYRQGKRLTAVKVTIRKETTYTVANESQHIFIYGVPQIKLRNELKRLCSKFGHVTSIHLITDHKTEIFTECYHVTYDRIKSARIAKRLLDNRSFYGGILHVCYAPEYETLDETRNKLMNRNQEVLQRLRKS